MLLHKKVVLEFVIFVLESQISIFFATGARETPSSWSGFYS